MGLRFASMLAVFAALCQAQWRAGVAKVRITPERPVWMAGYDGRTGPSEGALHDIWVKALALESAGAVSAIVTFDLVGVNPSIAGPLAERAEKLGIPRERLLLNASHTHTGPAAGEEWIERYAYRMNDAQIAASREYGQWLIGRAEQAIASAVRNLAPARLSFEQGLAGIAVNRRRAVMSRALPGVIDPDVPVLAVRSPEAELRAVLFGYASHNTTLGVNRISGDYAGFAMIELERRYPGATAMYMAGCGADANPLPRRTVELAESHGRTLAAAVAQVLDGRMKPVEGPLRAAYGHAPLPFAPAPSIDELRKDSNSEHPIRRRHALQLLKIVERDGRLPDHYPAPVQVWRFGSGPMLIALSGEAVADYALRFKAKYGWDSTWVAAYSNDVFAYVPSLRVLREGGYEGGDSMLYRPLPGPFGAAVEETLAAKVDELARRP